MNDKNKAPYIRNLHKRVDEWNANIEKLKAEAEDAEAEVESCDECLRKLKSLQEKSQETEQMVAEIQAAGEAMLQDLRSGVQNARDAMEEALRTAQSRLK